MRAMLPDRRCPRPADLRLSGAQRGVLHRRDVAELVALVSDDLDHCGTRPVAGRDQAAAPSALVRHVRGSHPSQSPHRAPALRDRGARAPPPGGRRQAVDRIGRRRRAPDLPRSPYDERVTRLAEAWERPETASRSTRRLALIDASHLGGVSGAGRSSLSWLPARQQPVVPWPRLVDEDVVGEGLGRAHDRVSPCSPPLPVIESMTLDAYSVGASSHTRKRRPDDRARVHPAVLVEVGVKHPRCQRLTRLQRNRSSACAHDHARDPLRCAAAAHRAAEVPTSGATM
jgi:hypothetical protein